MKAVILTAGEGKRMRPLTQTRPKVMLPIANTPILEHSLVEMKQAGIEEFIFIVGYYDEVIRGYFGNGEEWGVRIDYSTQDMQLGTADAVRNVENIIDGNFLVANGDVLIESKDILALMGSKNTTMCLYRVEGGEDLGMVETDRDRVIRIYEKEENPPTKLANAGLYLFTPDIFTVIANTQVSSRGEYEITDSLQLLIDKGDKVSYRTIDFWLDTSYPWDLLTANERLLDIMEQYRQSEIEEGVTVNGMVCIGRNTEIRAGTYISGPVIIGDDCTLGPNCYIRPGTSIGNGCHIGAAVEIKNSIIFNNTKIPHLNYVGDSIIGEGCNLGAGTMIANLRFDGEDISVDGIDTGRRKLGAIIGDNVETGVNVSINPGTVIGNNTHIGPGVFVHGIIEANSKILRERG